MSSIQFNIYKMLLLVILYIVLCVFIIKDIRKIGFRLPLIGLGLNIIVPGIGFIIYKIIYFIKYA